MEATIPALLRQTLERPSEFYRRRMRAAGIVGADPPLEAWSRLVPTQRSELVADQLAHPPFGSRALAPAPTPVRAGMTGSGADLLVLTWTAADLARERTAGVRSLVALGVRPRMRVANTLPGALSTPGSLLVGDVVDELGALDIPLGEITDTRSANGAWRLMQRVQPDVLVLRPHDADILFADPPDDGVPSLQSLLWLQTTAQWKQPLLPPRFAGTQGAWLAIPEAASFAAVRCAAGCFHPDAAVFAEIVDDRGATPSAASQGSLLLTSIGGDSPLLRYASGMRAAFATCSCGGPAPAFRFD